MSYTITFKINFTVTVGERAVFECEVDENVKVTWLKDNKPLSIQGESDRFTILSTDTGHRLEIYDVKDSDAGSYTARAYNTATNTSSYCTAQLAIDKKGNQLLIFFFFTVTYSLSITGYSKTSSIQFLVEYGHTPNCDISTFIISL